ncbi:MAG: DUF1569 domain-containing protein [Saprospiraceae bacterium]
MNDNIFKEEDVNILIARLNRLKRKTEPLWGKMAVGQMLAHLNIGFEMIYEKIHPKPNVLMKFILKRFVKKSVVSKTPYPKNARTAPQFLIKEDRDFEVEKKRIHDYILKTLNHGESYFDGRDYHSFGVMTKEEYNNMLYKHINHHFTQFGV